jgi:drug/metabolite transporter (DMT)-like permease
MLMALVGAFGGIGQLALTRAYSLESAPRVSAVGYLAVPLNTALGALLLRELPNARAMAGICLVFGSTSLVTFGPRMLPRALEHVYGRARRQ